MHEGKTISRHFTILVYPFRHTISGQDRLLRLKKMSGRWHPWWRRLNQTEHRDALDDTYFFLPHVRKLLFPETALLPETNLPDQLAELARLADLSIEKLAERIPAYGVLRFTCDPGLLRNLEFLQLDFVRTNPQGELVQEFHAPVRVDWIDLCLFPQNVGFLIFKVQLDEEKIVPERLVQFLGHLRLVHPPAAGWQLATWRHRNPEVPLNFKSQDLVDYLIQGFTERSEYIEPAFDTFIINAQNNHPSWRYSFTGLGQAYGHVFHQFSYACLAPPETIPLPSSNEVIAGSSTSEPRLFASAAQRVLYELVTCTQATHPDHEPHPIGLGQLMEKGHIALWANWEGMALHDNIVFLATRASHFTLHVLAQNVESDYFQLCLLTLYQKIRLSVLSGEVMRQESDLYGNLREARLLWGVFEMFRNHFWFTEVTFRPQGNELYHRFQQGLDILPLYDSICQKVRELQEYYEGKAAQRVGALLNFLTFIGLPAGILTQLFAGALIKEASWDQFIMVTVLVYVGVGLAWLVWSRLGKE